MKLPFVSRARFEEVERRLAESEAERKELLGHLLSGQPSGTAEVKVAETSENKTDVVPFTTPIDSMIRRYKQAGVSARDPKFKARIR